jgi:hypothetical protein
LELHFEAHAFVAFAITLDTPGFESLFEQGYRPCFDQWSGTYSCATVASTQETTTQVVSVDEDGDERLSIELDGGGRLVSVSVCGDLTCDLPYSAMSLGGRLFEIDTGPS